MKKLVIFLSVIFFSSSAFAFDTLKKFVEMADDGIEGKEVTQMYLMGFYEGQKYASFQLMTQLKGKSHLFMDGTERMDLITKIFGLMTGQGYCNQKPFIEIYDHFLAFAKYKTEYHEYMPIVAYKQYNFEQTDKKECLSQLTKDFNDF